MVKPEKHATSCTSHKTTKDNTEIKRVSNTDRLKKSAQLLSSSCFYKTPAVLVIVISGKSILADRGRKNVHKIEKIHFHLIYGYFVTVNQFLMMTVEFA